MLLRHVQQLISVFHRQYIKTITRFVASRQSEIMYTKQPLRCQEKLIEQNVCKFKQEYFSMNVTTVMYIKACFN
jgi:predicted RNA-binding protein with PIN domain